MDVEVDRNVEQIAKVAPIRGSHQQGDNKAVGVRGGADLKNKTHMPRLVLWFIFNLRIKNIISYTHIHMVIIVR